MKWWVHCSLKCNYSGEIETPFHHNETFLKRKLTGSILVGVKVIEVPLNAMSSILLSLHHRRQGLRRQENHSLKSSER